MSEQKDKIDENPRSKKTDPLLSHIRPSEWTQYSGPYNHVNNESRGLSTTKYCLPYTYRKMEQHIP